MPVLYFIARISSDEISRNLQSFDKVSSEGCICPVQYCVTVGQETPIARAISVFVLPERSISYFKFCDISCDNVCSITI